MKLFKSTKSKIITLILCCLLAGCVLAGISGTGTSPLTRFVSSVFYPLTRLSCVVADGLEDFALSFRSANYYRSQVAELQNQVNELQSQLADYEDTKQKLESLGKTYGILEEHSDYETLYATVIARDSANLYGGFTLDKGAADGVEVNDPVIYGEGNLIGLVKKVNENSSVVMSVTDPDMSIGVYEISTGEDGYLMNDTTSAFAGMMKFAGLSSSTTVNEGGIVCSTGVGGLVPENLVLGTIVNVGDDNDGSVFAAVSPSVDISSVRNAFIITSFTGQGE